MRMLAVAFFVMLPGAAGAVAVDPIQTVKSRLPPSSSADCPRTTSYHAFDPGQPVRPQKLGELPPANIYAAVLVYDGKCEVPLIIKYGVGR